MSTETSNNDNISRPPVIVILGHVDHGKTSILDKIRETKVADKEAGGITQHIGAYQVEVGSPSPEASADRSKTLTFLDTPGHEAFGAIRSRGVHVADIAILVVAADEGPKPQTKESVKILQESKTPFVVAINKIDTSGADAMKVRQQLAELEVLVEDYGGQTPVVELSAKTGDGLDNLLETVSLLADLEELTADSKAVAQGVVIESHMDKFKGIVATLLVQQGTLGTGDSLAAGSAVCRIKALEDFKGKRIKKAFPSQPCVVLGWDASPSLGATFEVVKDKKAAEKIAKDAAQSEGALFAREIPNQTPEGEIFKVANLIVKTDVQSSLEAVDQTLRTIVSDKAGYRVVDHGVGDITDTDVKNARAKDASIIGFGVSVDKSVTAKAERDGVRIETSNIIYKLVEAVREIMTGLLPAEVSRTLLGKLKILATFGTSGKAQIVGGRVTDGKAVRGSVIDVLRGKEVIDSGKLVQLQQGKEDTKEVASGNECGIKFEPSVAKATEGKPADPKETPEIKENDVLEFYEEEKITPEL